MLDINNYSFSYKQLSAPDARKQVNDFECIIIRKEDDIKFGIKFSCRGDPNNNNNEIFDAFCNKDLFKEQFFIECGELVKEEIKEVKQEIKSSENNEIIEVIGNDTKVIDSEAKNQDTIDNDGKIQ